MDLLSLKTLEIIAYIQDKFLFVNLKLDYFKKSNFYLSPHEKELRDLLN